MPGTRSAACASARDAERVAKRETSGAGRALSVHEPVAKVDPVPCLARDPLEEHERAAVDGLQVVAAHHVRVLLERDPGAHLVVEQRTVLGQGEGLVLQGLQRVGEVALLVEAQVHLTHAAGLHGVHQVTPVDSVAPLPPGR
jgi:hypothetical protein